MHLVDRYLDFLRWLALVFGDKLQFINNTSQNSAPMSALIFWIGGRVPQDCEEQVCELRSRIVQADIRPRQKCPR